MLDWVDLDCRDWGAATRKILDATNGYPRSSALERARLWIPRPDNLRVQQHWREVRTGQALAVERAIRQQRAMPEDLYVLIFAQYVLPGPVKSRAYAVEQYTGRPVAVRDYWRQLENAHYFLSARLMPPGETLGLPATPGPS